MSMVYQMTYLQVHRGNWIPMTSAHGRLNGGTGYFWCQCVHGIPALKWEWVSERQRAYPGIRFEGGAPDHCGGGGRGCLEQRRESQKTFGGGLTSSENRRGHQDIFWCRKIAENRGGSAKNTRRIPWSSKYQVVHGIRSLGQNLAPPAKIFVSHEVLRSKILHGICSVSRWDKRSRLQFAYE